LFTKIVFFTLVVVGTFGILMTSMDARFIEAQTWAGSYQSDKEAATFFSTHNMSAQAYTQFTLLEGYGNSHSETFNLPNGHEIEFWWAVDDIGPLPDIRLLEVRHTWPGPFGFGRSHENLKVIYPYSDDVELEEWGLQRQDLVNLWEMYFPNASYCEWAYGGYGTKTFISPNATGNSIGESWDLGNVTMTVGFSYNWTEAHYDVFTILGQMLSFSAPSVGVPGEIGIIMDFFVSFPLWILIIIALLMLLQSIIPTIRGIPE